MIDFKISKEGLVVSIENDFNIEELKAKLSKLKTMFSGLLKIVLYIGDGNEEHLEDILRTIKLSGFKLKKISFDTYEENEKELKGMAIYNKNIRSGQVLVESGDVILLGNVNSGGEIITGGSLVVFGGLYGTARVGMNKGYDSIIIALDLRPSLIQIVDKFSHEKSEEAIPTLAYVKDGRIVYKKWAHFKLNEVVRK